MARLKSYSFNKLKIFSFVAATIVTTVAISVVVFAQWTEPTQAPPGGNVATPINVSATAQTKTGSIGANAGFFVDGFEMVGNNADFLYANRRNTAGGGLWVSPPGGEGGFFDYNNTYIDFRGTAGLRILDSAGALSANSRIITEWLCLDADCRDTWPSGGAGGGDITDVFAGTGITVTNSAGPQPTVSIKNNAFSCGAADQGLKSINIDTGVVTCETDDVGAGGGVLGGGTLNYLTKFTLASPATIGNSQVFDNGINVGVGIAPASYKLDVSGGDINVSGIYRIGGVAGVSRVCAAGTTPSGITISGGIITSSGACAAFGAGGGGDITDVLAGTGITVTNSAGPQPTVSVKNNAFSCGAANQGLKSINIDTGVVTCEADDTGSGVLGGGTVNYLTKFTLASPATIGNSQVFDNGTNVGIGTASPVDKLMVHLGADLNVGVGVSTYLAIVSHNDAWTAWGNLQLNNAMYLIGSSGNVGIGTATPGVKLEIAGSIRGNISGALRIDSGSGTVDIGAMNASFAHIYTDRPAFYTDKGMYIGVANSYFNTSAGNSYIAASGGNVGIGTTSPGAKLHIVGSSTFNSENGPLMVADSATTWNRVHIGYDASRDIAYISAIHGGAHWDNIVFQGGGGNVGIGTTSPGASLDIGGAPTYAIRTQYLMISGNNSGITDRPYFRGAANHIVSTCGGTVGGGTCYYAYPGDLSSGTMNTRIQESLFITATGGAGGGNVGIGIATPTYKLQVNGNTYSTKYYCAAGDVAENTPVSEKLLPAEVVCLDENEEGKLSHCDGAYDSKVAGVVSSGPGIILGETAEIVKVENVPLALAGRVPVKTTTENGSISVGDLLVSGSRPGYAMKADKEKINQLPGVVLGKAMESLAQGEGEIMVLVTLK